MNKKLKASIDYVLKLANAQKVGILILTAEGKNLHIAKNCTPQSQAWLMFNYIEGKAEIQEAFTDHVRQKIQEDEKQDLPSPEPSDKNTDTGNDTGSTGTTEVHPESADPAGTETGN